MSPRICTSRSTARQRRINGVRYWLPLLAAIGCLFVATRVTGIVTFVLIIVAFALVIEVSTKLLEQSGGGLGNHRQ